ncbi:MAG: gp436 family protein [Alphaproteobacteria bacterium]
MSYVDTAQLVARYGEPMLVALTDRGPVPSGTWDPETVERAIIDTAALIDGHLAARYRLPLAEVPPLLRDLAGAIAIWKLHAHKPDDKIEADYRDARRTLDEIAAGRVRLPVGAGAEPEGTGGSGARITDRARPFTERNLKGFV